MNVLMISPGFPEDLQYFTAGLAEVGAHVLGIGDQPRGALPERSRRSLADYHQVQSLWEEEAVVSAVQQWLRGRSLDRVECLWEPGVVLAARLREAFDVPGLTVDQAVPFRDKEIMKQKLDAAGIRTPHHFRASTEAEVRTAAEKIGYPLIVKPIAGAGSADTYAVREPSELDDALELIKHVPEVSVEEFIDGEEFTYDTVCGGGKILFENVAWYRPKPLLMRLNAWISPQAICLRDLEQQEIRVGVELGRRVNAALGLEAGFGHMEWFLTPEGEAVFGEIGARSPGGRLVHGMNYSCDLDLFTAWAEAVCYGRISQDTTKRYNAAVIFKRAQGGGDEIIRHEGLGHLMSEYGEHVASIDLNPVGAPRKDWRKVIEGDGWVVVRHPNLEQTVEIANHVATDLKVVAG